MTIPNFIIALLLIASSSLGQSKKENLKVFWPEEYKWKTIINTDDSTASFVQIIPENESTSNWTIAVTIRITKNAVAPNLDLIIKAYTESALKESSKAKVTVVERNDSTKHFWVLLKTETTDFPNDPIPESDFWFIQQGSQNHFAVFVAIREKEFSQVFIDKWTKIFKLSKIVYE